MWPVRLIAYCWPVYYSQSLEQLWLLQYSKLQMAKTVVKISVVWVYNTYTHRDSQLCMNKYKTHMLQEQGNLSKCIAKSGYGNGVRPSTIMTAVYKKNKTFFTISHSRICINTSRTRFQYSFVLWGYLSFLFYDNFAWTTTCTDIYNSKLLIQGIYSRILMLS